uniref:Uncharacterized protein n=1 Tax=Knipowitschia caucasica TaxID=637954 RepID=A0AAV2L9S5_KNICA
MWWRVCGVGLVGFGVVRGVWFRWWGNFDVGSWGGAGWWWLSGLEWFGWCWLVGLGLVWGVLVGCWVSGCGGMGGGLLWWVCWVFGCGLCGGGVVGCSGVLLVGGVVGVLGLVGCVMEVNFCVGVVGFVGCGFGCVGFRVVGYVLFGGLVWGGGWVGLMRCGRWLVDGGEERWFVGLVELVWGGGVRELVLGVVWVVGVVVSWWVLCFCCVVVFCGCGCLGSVNVCGGGGSVGVVVGVGGGGVSVGGCVWCDKGDIVGLVGGGRGVVWRVIDWFVVGMCGCGLVVDGGGLGLSGVGVSGVGARSRWGVVRSILGDWMAWLFVFRVECWWGVGRMGGGELWWWPGCSEFGCGGLGSVGGWFVVWGMGDSVRRVVVWLWCWCLGLLGPAGNLGCVEGGFGEGVVGVLGFVSCVLAYVVGIGVGFVGVMGGGVGAGGWVGLFGMRGVCGVWVVVQ